MLAAGWPDRHFDVLPEADQKLEQPSNRKASRAIAHQEGDVGLLDAERRRRLALRHAPLPDDAVNPEREAGLNQLLLGVGQAEIGKDIGAAFGNA